jgi:hypothetical protein
MSQTQYPPAPIVLQTGKVTPGHVTVWNTNGVVQDGGTAQNGNITAIGIQNSGNPAYQINNAPVTGPFTAYTEGFLPGTNTFQIGLNSFAGAPAANLQFSINGTIFSFPSGGSGTGNVTGPTSAVANDLVSFNGTTGTLIQDSGIQASEGNLTVPGVSTFSGDSTFKAPVTFDASATFGSSVAVSGAATFGSSVAIDGSLTLNSSLDVDNLVVTTAPLLAQPSSTAIDVTTSGTGTNTSGNGGWFNLIDITSDNIDAQGNFIDGFAVNHNVGGSAMQGGRQALASQLFFNSATSALNTNRNYVGALTECIASAGDGGTASDPLGAYFGLNAVCETTDAPNILNASACEFDISCGTGTSVEIKTGIQVVSLATDAVHGSQVDAAIAVSAEIGGAGFTTGIQFSQMSGHTPIIDNGVLIQVQGAGVTLAVGIDLSSWTVTGNLIQGQPGGGALSNTALTLGGGQVVGERIGGWGTSTGGLREPITSPSTISLATLAGVVSQLLTDLETHGLLGV